MDKKYQPQLFEQKIYDEWEKKGLFTPKINKKKKPFTIILPLPNANDPMHMGHAMFVIEDIMIRYQKMRGKITLWLPGSDHAGIETQFVFEKELRKKGQSRFDYDRQTLYQMIWNFVEKNRKINIFQMKELGFALDWSRYHYSLEPGIVKQILTTFRKLHQGGLIYRAQRVVNYCPSCGTAFSDLEVDHQEEKGELYCLDYGIIKIATTRPETIFADVAVAVNPKDKRYQKLVGKEAIVPLIDKKIPIVADDLVDKDFGTGALKITPAHDATDFEIGKKHDLPLVACLDFKGKIVNALPGINGLKIEKAREITLEKLQKAGKLIKTEAIDHTLSVCYRCGSTIEPLPTPQWFVKTKPLVKGVIAAIKKGETRVFPFRFKRVYLDWLENIRDWNISRQIVWGPQIPAWYCLDCNPQIQLNFLDKKGELIGGKYQEFKNKYSYSEIKKGLQTLSAPIEARYELKEARVCSKCQGKKLLQETDTFDTWFLSGQWPLTALGFNVQNPEKNSADFNYFYPTSVLDTLWDILFFWVARMMIFGFYLAKKTPFKLIHLHAKVVDEQGQKMSKSKGNVLNPSQAIEKYGADALRMALIYGVGPASNIALSDKKIEAMRNFTNKIWNAARFIHFIGQEESWKLKKSKKNKDDQEILRKLNNLIVEVDQHLQKYRYGQALEMIYQFFWHEFCDLYLEKAKKRKAEALPVLLKVLTASLKLLHPFAPFVTEAVYQNFRKELKDNSLFKSEYLMTASWPKKDSG
ncbi:MAG: valine--tRNA ligase [Candidatus Shapirobacteria bacterium]